jgi:hypothetical protein
MKCGKCGKTLKGSATLCDGCGVVVPYGSEPSVHSSSWWDRILVTLCIGSIGSFFLFAYFTYEPPKEPCPKADVDSCRRLSQELQDLTPQKINEVAKYPKEILEHCVELKNKGCFK